MKREKSKKKKPLSCINGVKGAISLFLAVLMTPFLTIAVMLVEIGRYNSAVSVLDEALGVTSLSTLANYDDYLQERWGLLALSQDLDINALYANYLDTNSAVMGSALSINKVTAAGGYALSDADILEAQLMEYCKLNAPTKLGSEIASKVAGLTGLTDALKGLKSLGNIASLLTKGVSTLDSGITMAESAEELKKAADELDKLKTEYDDNYKAFSKAMNTLIDNLKEKKEQEELKAPLDKELKTLQEELKKLEEKETKTDAEKKANQEAIKNKKEEISEKEKEIKPYKDAIDKLNKTIKSNRTSLTKAKDKYATTISNITANLKTFREHMANCEEAVLQIQENVAGAVSDGISIGQDLIKKRGDLEENEKDLKALKEDLKKWEEDGKSKEDPGYIAGLEYKIALEEKVTQLQTEIGELETASALSGAVEDGIGKMADEWKESSGEYSDATIGAYITAFEALHRKVNGVDSAKITVSTAKATKETYKNVAVAGYIAADEIQAYLDEQEKDLKEGSLKALLEGLMAIYNKLMGLSVFYEAKLNSVIDLNYYNTNYGGLPGGASAENPILNIMKNIGTICKEGGEFLAHLAKAKLKKMLEDLKSMVENLISLFENIKNLITDFLTNIAELFTTPDKWYTAAYCTYNLACRTDFSDASNNTSVVTMTGYKAGKESFNKPLSGPGIPGFGELIGLINTIVESMTGTGKDIMFTGAELEYVMFGSTNEIVNQLYVFVVMYLIRMLSSIPAIMADAEVQSLASAATLGYPVVIALYVLLEPLVQTVLLVNGNEQALIPSEVYLSPSGLPKLVCELVWFCNLTDAESEALSNKMIDASVTDRKKYDDNLKKYKAEGKKVGFSLDFNYKDYCLVVLLLTVTKDRQIARLSNLIQMETLCYYQNQKVKKDFDLSKSFTFLDVNAEVDVNQILPSLIDSSLFSVTRKHYRGY